MSEAKQEFSIRMLLLAARVRLYVHPHLVMYKSGSEIWHQEGQTSSTGMNPVRDRLVLRAENRAGKRGQNVTVFDEYLPCAEALICQFELTSGETLSKMTGNDNSCISF